MHCFFDMRFILVCALLFISNSLHAVEKAHLSTFSYAANNDDPSVKFIVSYSKCIVRIDVGGTFDRFLLIDVANASVMYAASDNVDIGFELRRFLGLSYDQKPMSFAASCRYLFDYPNNKARSYIKTAVGVYDHGISHIDPSKTYATYAGIGVDYKIASNIFLNFGIDMCFYEVLILSREQMGAQFLLNIGVGIAF